MTTPRPACWTIGFLLSFAGWITPLRAAPAAQQTTTPFQNFRERTLEVTDFNSETQAPGEVTELVLGWFGPSTEDDPDGGGMWWAASLAVREANEAGGCLGIPIRLVPIWSTNPWGTGVASLFRFIYQQHPRALLGSINGPATHLAEQVVAKARMPLVSPVSTDASVTLAGVPWVFACAPTDDAVAAVLVEALVLGADSASVADLMIISATDHDSRLAAQAIRQALARRHQPLHHAWSFSPETTPSPAQLERLRLNSPSTIVLVAGVEDSVRWTIALRNLDLPAALFGWHSMGRSRFARLAGAAAEGVRFPLMDPLDLADDATRRFIQTTKCRFGESPDYAIVYAYEATRILIEAIREAGGSRAAIRQALAARSTGSGLAGQTGWTGTGQRAHVRVVMGTVKNGCIIAETR